MATAFTYMPIRDIEKPQMIRVPANGGVLDIYTGYAKIHVDHGSEVRRHNMYSLVPLPRQNPPDPFRVQEYPGPLAEAAVQTAMTASLTSFGDAPKVAAVDWAQVELRPAHFHEDREGVVLLMNVAIAVAEGVVLRFAYQINVFTPGSRDILSVLDERRQPVPGTADGISTDFRQA